MNDTSSVIAVYDTVKQMADTVRQLQEAGIDRRQISILAHDLSDEDKLHGYVVADHPSRREAAAGAWMGGIFGMALGAAFVWVPGFGPLFAAGPIAATLIGALEGAAAGAAGMGLIGALVGWGVSEEETHVYADMVRSGKKLVIVHGNEDVVQRAYSLLQQTGATLLDIHAHRITGGSLQ